MNAPIEQTATQFPSLAVEHPSSTDLVTRTLLSAHPGHQLQSPATDVPPTELVVSANAPLRSRTRHTRNGKIARLPTAYRDLVNNMLRNNLPYQRIVAALEDVGVTVTERNISNWKTRGGYKEWCLAQDHAVSLRLHQDNLIALLRKDNATDISEIGLQVAATRLSEFFLTPEAAQVLASDPEEYHRRLADLARVNAELLKLQKQRRDSNKEYVPYRKNPDRVRRDEEMELERVRDVYSSTFHPDAPGDDPRTPHRNVLPKN